MMRGKRSMALAVRDQEGVIRLDTKRLKDSGSIWFKIPVIRGALRFFQSMVDGVKILMRSAEVFGEAEPSKFEKWLSEKLKVNLMSVVTTFAMVLGLGLAVFLFTGLPNLLVEGFKAWIPGISDGWQQVILAVSKLVIMLCYLLLTSLMKDIRRTFMYHGAEHKCINCYEHELPMTVENVKKSATFHNRCGTTFLFFTILVSVFVSVLLGVNDPVWLRMLKRIAALPLIAGLAYEILKLVAMTDSKWLFPLRLPGILMQKITVREPDESMMEVALTAFNSVLEMDEDESIPEVQFDLPKKYSDVRAEAEANLAEIPDVGADIDWIFCAALKTQRLLLKERTLVSPAEYARITDMVSQRKSGKPLQYILAETDFYGCTVELTPDVLIPRFETELLAEQAAKSAGPDTRILDLCTGSGCIAVSVQKKTGAKMYASDISLAALEVAKRNAAKNGAEVEFFQDDLFSALPAGSTFDIIVSNPPYIPSEEIAALQREVKDFEPHIALDGGADGLDFYKKICTQAKEYLSGKGLLLLEVGHNQAKAVAAMLESEFDVKIIKDYEGKERIIRAAVR